MKLKRRRRTRTDKLVAGLEKALHRDLGQDQDMFANFPLMKKYRDYYRAVSINYGGEEITITLRRQSGLVDSHYIQRQVSV